MGSDAATDWRLQECNTSRFVEKNEDPLKINSLHEAMRKFDLSIVAEDAVLRLSRLDGATGVPTCYQNAYC